MWKVLLKVVEGLVLLLCRWGSWFRSMLIFSCVFFGGLLVFFFISWVSVDGV